MDYKKIFEKIMEKMEMREKNTEKAKKDLSVIMEILTDLIPDKVSGYGTKKTFLVKASWWDGSGWVHFQDEAHFEVIDGKIWAIGDYGKKVFCSEDIEDDVDYINFKQMVPALIEFIEGLAEIATWDSEAEIIEKIKNSLPPQSS